MSEKKKVPATFVVAAGQAPLTAEEVIAFFRSADFEADTTYLVNDPSQSGFISVTEYEYEYDPEN
jgi:hypothetical protein